MSVERAPIDLPVEHERVPTASFSNVRSIFLKTCAGVSLALGVASAPSAEAAGPPRLPEKDSTPTTVDAWVQSRQTDVHQRMEKLVTQLDANEYEQRQRAQRELVQVEQHQKHLMNPTPFSVSQYQSEPKSKTLSAEQHARVREVANQFVREPTRLPPIKGTVQSILDELSKLSGSKIIIEKSETDEDLSTLPFQVSQGYGSYWQVLSDLQQRTGLVVDRIEGNTVVLKKQYSSRRLVATHHSYGVFREYVSVADDKPSVHTLTLMDEPNRGMLLSLKDVAVIQGRLPYGTQVRIWPEKRPNVHYYFEAVLQKSPEHKTPYMVPDPILELTVRRGVGPQKQTLLLDPKEACGQMETENHKLYARVTKHEDGTWGIKEEHFLWSQIPWPPTSTEWDADTYRVGAATERTVYDENDTPMVVQFEKAHFCERKMHTHIRCPSRPVRIEYRMLTDMTDDKVCIKVPNP